MGLIICPKVVRQWIRVTNGHNKRKFCFDSVVYRRV